MSLAKELCDTALKFARDGFSIIPIRPGSKTPLLLWARYQRWPLSLQKISRIWQRGAYNVAVLCAAGAAPKFRRLVILDYDCPELFARHSAFLPETWITETGRAGCRHVWLYAPGPVASRKIGALDVKGVGGYCMIPPSLHPSGERYRWLQRPKHIAEVGWELLERIGLQRPSQPDPQITTKAWRILQGTRSARGRPYATRSEAEHAAVMSMVTMGSQWEAVYGAFSSHAHERSKFRELERTRGPDNAMNWLRRSYAKARARERAQSGVLRAAMDSLLAQVPDLAMTRRSAANVRAVYGALVRQAVRLQKPEISFSVRAIGDAVGLSKNAVARALAVLRAHELLQPLNTISHGSARKYALPVLRTGDQNVPYRYTPRGGDCVECTAVAQSSDFVALASHDAFRYGGLGKSGVVVWLCLESATEPQSRAAIAEQTGVPVRTVSRRLSDMGRVGMVVCDRQRWSAVHGVSLDAAAEALGTAGAGWEQMQRNKADRIEFDLLMGRRGR